MTYPDNSKRPSRNLPQPSAHALAHSDKLLNHIINEIEARESKISFTRFMELALYAPGLGYYCSGTQKFGATGDFITAPEISPLFGQCLARQCQQVLQHCLGGVILELGAGSGKLAATLLTALADLGAPPQHYYILEVSADLKQRQQQTIKQQVPELAERVSWLQSLPQKPFTGIVLANEVLDAMPVHRFRIEGEQILECFVGQCQTGLFEFYTPSKNKQLSQFVSQLKQTYLQSVKHYDSEVNLNLAAWLQSISEILNQGLVLLIDYGYPTREYYHPDRTTGTLMCHYRHFAHTHPLFLPGLQDITAHVDFSQLADYAFDSGFDIEGYTTQAAFLLNCGLLEATQSPLSSAEKASLKTKGAIKIFTHPSEMGELYKVIALSKDLGIDLLGFNHYNLLAKL